MSSGYPKLTEDAELCHRFKVEDAGNWTPAEAQQIRTAFSANARSSRSDVGYGTTKAWKFDAAETKTAWSHSIVAWKLSNSLGFFMGFYSVILFYS